MLKRIALMLICVLLTTGMTVVAEEDTQCVSVMAYAYDKCGNCGVTINKPGCGECTLILQIFGQMRVEMLDLINAGKVKFDVRNTQLGQYRPEYHAYADAFGVPDELLNHSPQIFIGAPENGLFVTGMEMIPELNELVTGYLENLPEGARTEYPADELAEAASKLDVSGRPIEPEATAEASPEPTTEPEQEFCRNDDIDIVTKTDSSIVYVYKPNCEFCAKVKPLLEGLPDAVTLSDGTSSRVMFFSLDKDDYDQYQIVKQYYEALNIPEDHRYSPLLIVGDKFYMGYDEIVPNLMNALIAGDGVNTDLQPIIDAQ